eukprot:1156961-Pelagomonas_calceolata.AAC.2
MIRWGQAFEFSRPQGLHGLHQMGARQQGVLLSNKACCWAKRHAVGQQSECDAWVSTGRHAVSVWDGIHVTGRR